MLLVGVAINLSRLITHPTDNTAQIIKENGVFCFMIRNNIPKSQRRGLDFPYLTGRIPVGRVPHS